GLARRRILRDRAGVDGLFYASRREFQTAPPHSLCFGSAAVAVGSLSHFDLSQGFLATVNDMEFVFWSAVVFVLYSYLGYPVMLAVIGAIRSRGTAKGDIQPAVSFIIAAYNEEKRISAKIENTLRLNYPKDKFEVLVASDCSDDGTDEIVRSFHSQGVRLVKAAARAGKEAAQKLAIRAATGEVLVF